MFNLEKLRLRFSKMLKPNYYTIKKIYYQAKVQDFRNFKLL